MKHKRVRVVILNYNQPFITSQCVAKVLQQSYDPKDIVVVDNASSLEKYDELQALLPDNVTLVRNSHNAGYAAGNNVGVRFMESLERPELVMILNNDVFLDDQNAIMKLTGILQGKCDTVAVSPLVHNTALTEETAESEIQIRRDADYLSCLVSGSWWLRRLPLLKKISDLHVYADVRPYALYSEYECDSINGACFVIRRDFLEDIGYFDEGTFLYFEEIVLGHQIKQRGKKCALVTSVIVDHHQGATTKQKSGGMPFKMYREYIKSEAYYCEKYLESGFLKLAFLRFVRMIDFVSKNTINLIYNLNSKH